MKGEKIPADEEAAQPFMASSQKFTKEKNRSLDQTINCDETGLLYHLLPEKAQKSFKKSTDH